MSISKKSTSKKLQSLGSLKFCREPPRTPDDLKQRTADADIVVVGWSKMTKDVFNSAKKLRVIWI